MNLNLDKFTTKSLEALQHAQQLTAQNKNSNLTAFHFAYCVNLKNIS